MTASNTRYGYATHATAIRLLVHWISSIFLSAGIFATLIIPVWILYLYGIIQTNSYGSWWHGHEMIHGFLAAVLGGFLLTAVQNWTGKPTAQRHLLFYVWMDGWNRIAM